MGRRGYTVIEMLIASIIGLILLAAMMGVLLHQQRFYLLASDISDTMSEVHRVEQIMEPELLPLNATVGDIRYAGADSIKVRVFRGVFAVCSKGISSDVFITVRRLTTSSIPLSADSAFVYSRGSSPSLSDDRWVPVKLNGVNDAVCPDGTAAWRATVPALNGISSEIPIGASLRVFHDGSYWLTSGSEGWYLMTNATSGEPTTVAGPLTPPDAPAPSTLRFHYYDSAGNLTTSLTDIARIKIEAAAEGEVPTKLGGRPYRFERDLYLRMRNNG